MSEKPISGSDTKRAREAFGCKLHIFYPRYIGLSPGAGSRFENGDLQLRYEHRQKIEENLRAMQALQQQSPEVLWNMNHSKTIRKVREIAREQSQEIPQQWSVPFIAAFWAFCGLTVPEFLAICQLRAALAQAEQFSIRCQQWVHA